jgi:uncharacterized protein
MNVEKKRSFSTGRPFEVSIDEGLRSHMLRIYNYMAGGLGLTGLVAYIIGTNPAFSKAIWGTPLAWVVIFAPLVMVFFLSMRIEKMSASAAQTTFWVYATLMGLSLSSIFLQYTGISIARTFFITSGMFGAMSLYGYTTKKDLSGLGSFLMMGLFGVIIASVVNIFLKSSALHFAVSIVGVLVFIGLTAYDTQKIKNMYTASDDSETASKKAIMGALQLYLDFINLFLILLQFFGNRRD